MQIKLQQPYLSIKTLESVDLPSFTALIGRNGVGKTHLIEAIKKGYVTVSGFLPQDIAMYGLDSFKLKDSPVASWGDCLLPELAAETYFGDGSNLSPVVKAKKIFEEVINDFNLIDGSSARREFEKGFKNEIRGLDHFRSFPLLNYEGALSTYFAGIKNIIHTLKSSRDAKNAEIAELVILAVKMSEKFPHEISRNDILRAGNYEGDTIENTLSNVFARYKIEQFSWAHTKGETSQESFQTLMSQYLETTPPPWEILREYLDDLRDVTGDPNLFNFEFSDPANDKIDFPSFMHYSFKTNLTNRATGQSYSAENLSSGEKILMSLCLASFNQSIGRRRPKLMLLDELDSVLHPSMVSALIAGLKTQFVQKGTRVIIATHLVTTVTMLDEGEIFRVARVGGKVEVLPVKKAYAVSELSEGIATIDTGLKIALSDSAPITILTEGNNVIHLKKWVELFFPGKVEVFDSLPDKTSKNQLKTYGQFLSKVNTDSHFLIVWDCDAEAIAKKFSSELAGSANVTGFSFSKRENKIAPKGIENNYDEEILKPFANKTIEYSTGKEVSLSFNSKKKTEFAEHISANGTTGNFRHFSTLKLVVKTILNRPASP